jgi:uncharacterized membrane protein (DUF4010 family)
MAALAIAVGVLTNTVLKATVAAVVGARRFGLFVGGTLVVSATVGVSAIVLFAK